MSYKYLIIGPGAMGIFSMLGYLKSIENTLQDVKGYSGASAGAIICTFLALGYSVEETLYKLLELDPSKLVKLNLKCFINSYGLVDLKPVRQQLVNLLESDPTFSEIDKTLYISAFCVNTSKTEYFSKHTHPDMKVIDAICMSIAVPFIFSSYRYENMVYVDGGTLETLPTAPFLSKKPHNILCVRMKMQTQFIEEIKNPKQFAEALVSSTLNNRKNNDIEKSTVIDIDIGQVDVFNFNMSYEEKFQMYTKSISL
jgi:predicted acylesterase/phospholipase RssA